MAYTCSFKFAPAEWFAFRDQEVLDSVVNVDMYARQGNTFENPDFNLDIVYDVHNYFAIDLVHRIRMSDINDEKLVVILPSPENAVFITATELLNKRQISCRNLHVFFLYEYANEKGEVAPWQSPFSRSGQFMKYFYNRLEEHLRMPMDQIHFFTKENVATYSDELAALGGADVAYTAMSWSGGIGAIDPESFPAKTTEEFVAMGSRLVTPMPEMIAHDSLRGMFGCSGDIANVPPCAATVGPKDLMASKEWIDVEYLIGCGGVNVHQTHPLRLALFGPICPENPGSIMRLHKGTCYVCPENAKDLKLGKDHETLIDDLAAIAKKEQA